MQNKLKEKRLEKGLTQAEVANLIYCSKSYYSNLESCYRNPSLETAQRLSKALGCTVDDLFPLPSEVSQENNNKTVG